MRAARVLEAVGCDAFVASDPFTVAWLTGFAADETWGPNPFAVAPLAIVRSDASVVAIVSEDEAPALDGSGCEVVAYEGFTLGPLDAFAGRRAALAALGLSGRVAVEDGALPVPGVDAVQADAHALRLLRAVKDAGEIARIRAAIALCDSGQAAARVALRSGVSELEAWGAVQSAMELAAGERLSLLCDFATGERTGEIGGPPGPRVVRDGDLAIVDLVPRLAGYWGDSCSTVAIGDVPADIRAAHARCGEALERGLAAIAPGVVAGDLDALVRSGLDYPHHTGHGVGVAAHEEPRIVPGGETVLAPGMIVALEPGTYPGPWGMRLERLALVTDTGCEVLSQHDLEEPSSPRSRGGALSIVRGGSVTRSRATVTINTGVRQSQPVVDAKGSPVGWTGTAISLLVATRFHVYAVCGQSCAATGSARSLCARPRAMHPRGRAQSGMLEAMSGVDREFREVVGAFATGVCVVTSEHHGHPAGMTLNSFTSVSLDPLLVLVSLMHGSRTLEKATASQRFAVNILHRRQQDVALDFAKRGADFPVTHAMPDRYGYFAVRHALALLRCEVTEIVRAGDHDLVIGEVASYEGSGGEPLVFHRGTFGGLDADAHVPSGRVIGLDNGTGW